ncbi:EAL domain-containing protein [Acidovorax sp. PRC11]|uniref:EAL domain-containing protein n=1 Tax=Acidovorax sp. PRC11 TaxID=2962592 RepID=UPI0028822D32|nr:EAL domain-containing protein [Acidovorax sp. PRC11]MDT0136116.1 EAL domain-containing protein [Acidovorax sp. PRC11]
MNPSLSAEHRRLAALQATGLLDTPPSEEFDRITRLACQLFGVPIALVSLVDADRQWFKSRVGLAVPETCREDAFCDHTIRTTQVMVIEDTLEDPRFAQNALVQGEPRIRFYAGAPLVLRGGHALGSLCLIDTAPRPFGIAQQRQLEDLAAMVMAQIDLQCSNARVDEATLLPNRAQLLQDLVGLCRAEPGGHRVLALLELLPHDGLMDAIRAVGMQPVEQLTYEAGQRLAQFLGSESRIYHTSIARIALVLQPQEGDALRDFAGQLLGTFLTPLSDGSSGMVINQRRRVGLAPFTLEPADAIDALRRANAALYQHPSPDTAICDYDAAVDANYRRSYELIASVPRALSAGEFRLVYQPQFERATTRYTSVEALLRWDHPQLGPVPPGDFIPLLEKTVHIQAVTRWVLETALAQIRAWEDAGLVVDVAINVSPRNLEQPDFAATLREACARHRLAPSRLEIECTENAVLTDGPTLQGINAARALGVRVALDDFGTGYCNFGCLYGLSAEVLKLDQALIRPIGCDARALDVVRGMVQLGHTLGYRLLAEGVENAEVFDQLMLIGCD